MIKEIIIGTVSLLIPSLIAASYWLVKVYIPKKIEAQVNHQYNLKLEEFKSRLAITAAERQLRFSHVYEKSADVIQTYYKKMTDTRTALFLVLSDSYNQNSLLSGARNQKSLQEAAKDAEQALEEFLMFDINNSLYFPPVCEQMIMEMRSLFAILMDAIEMKLKMEGDPPSDVKVWKQQMQATIKAHEEKFKNVHHQLKSEFQKLIGVVIVTESVK
jgi:hypothetical protein